MNKFEDWKSCGLRFVLNPCVRVEVGGGEWKCDVWNWLITNNSSIEAK